MKARLFLVLGMIITATHGASWAASRIYVCEAGGQVIYTSRPSALCHASDLPPLGRYSSDYHAYTSQTEMQPKVAVKKATVKNRQPKATASKKPIAPVVATASAAPVAVKTSAANNRRMILESELSNEKRALADAQKALSQARSPQQIQAMQTAVSERQQNIRTLQRELSR